MHKEEMRKHAEHINFDDGEINGSEAMENEIDIYFWVGNKIPNFSLDFSIYNHKRKEDDFWKIFGKNEAKQTIKNLLF